MTDHYILNEKEPVAVDLMTWAKWFEDANRTLAKTMVVPGVEVSTVFLGLDHRFGEGSPLLFETMVFGPKGDEGCWRYATWDEAMEGHERAVRETRERLSGENIMAFPDLFKKSSG